MKIKLAIIALVIFGLSACTQRTCPTYTKAGNSVENPLEEKKANV